DLFGLPQRPGFWRYSIQEMSPKFKEFETAVQEAMAIEEKKRDLYQTKIVELRKHLEEYMKLARHMEPVVIPPSSADEQWASLAQVDEEATHLALSRMKAEAERNGQDLFKQPREKARAQFDEELPRARKEISPEAQAFAEMLDSYREGKVEQFNKAVAAYLA